MNESAKEQLSRWENWKEGFYTEDTENTEVTEDELLACYVAAFLSFAVVARRMWPPFSGRALGLSGK
jgi:hypothetical protein